MHKYLTLLFSLIFMATSMDAQDKFVGTWNGILNLSGTKLHLVLHFQQTEEGKMECLMDSPDQGAIGIKTTLNCLMGDSVSLAVPQIGMSYAGKLAGDTIEGTFRQGFVQLPLSLNRGNLKRERPQNPTLPLPYATKDVTFRNDGANATLAGTLSYPVGYEAGQKVPVVLMVSGSGQENRDEEIFGHKPFLVISDFLARNGIASLRYDDRGFGQSTGDAATATTRDFADDARAGVAFLRAMNVFSRGGVLGHSEGASIAFMLGAESEADFVVSMAGIGVRGDTALAAQANAILGQRGLPATMTTNKYREETAKQNIPWLNYFIDYDPASHIKANRQPVMAVNGSKDTQVICQLNLTAIRQLLPGNRHNMVKEYPSLNHIMQHCDTGMPEEYSQISQTVSPELLSDLAAWIRSLEE